MMLKEKNSNSQKWSKEGFLDSKESGAAHQFNLDLHGDSERYGMENDRQCPPTPSVVEIKPTLQEIGSLR